jgi:predicted phosphodiesterase
LLEKCNLKEYTVSHKIPKNTNYVGIIHITDTHFNELVNHSHNKYDFKVASSRLKKLVEVARTQFKAFGVKKVLVASTGDLLNSDRRLDEILAMSTNRSKATFLAVQLLQQVILDLNKDFNVLVTGVTGNESRIKEEIGYNELVATDNYDYTILEILKLIFKEAKGIEFINSGYNEGIVEIEGTNILLMHGYSQKTDIERYVQQIKGRYSSNGQKVDYVLMGHYHSTRLADHYARGASLVGSNDYNESNLNLAGRAAQNIFLISKEGDVHGTRVDLQNASNDIFGSYDINKELEAYNAKSAEKSKKGKKNYKIRIE